MPPHHLRKIQNCIYSCNYWEINCLYRPATANSTDVHSWLLWARANNYFEYERFHEMEQGYDCVRIRRWATTLVFTLGLRCSSERLPSIALLTRLGDFIGTTTSLIFPFTIAEKAICNGKVYNLLFVNKAIVQIFTQPHAGLITFFVSAFMNCSYIDKLIKLGLIYSEHCRDWWCWTWPYKASQKTWKVSLLIDLFGTMSEFIFDFQHYYCP